MNNFIENRLANNLKKKPDQHTARYVSLRTLLIAACILAVLCGVAYAAITWNSREYLTYTDEQGQTHINKELISLAQPILKTFEGDALRVDIVDAIFDGRSLILTWIMQNKQAEGDIYLLLEKSEDYSLNLFGQGDERSTTEVFISPGETVCSGKTTILQEPLDTDTLRITFSYSVLKPLGEVVPIDGIYYDDELDPQEQHDEYIRHIDELIAQGMLPVAPDNIIELGSNYPENGDKMTYAETLIAAGMMELIETVDVSFFIERNAVIQDLLPGGMPIEKDNSDYILRVVSAEITPHMVAIDLERVFQSQEAVERFAPYYSFYSDSEEHGLLWDFDFVDETDSQRFINRYGLMTDHPTALPDGTWVWPCEYKMEVQHKPQVIKIIPQREDPESDTFNMISYPEEAIVLQVPEG